MKLTADTNILLRAFVIDDPQQTEMAQQVVADAEPIAVPVIVLCELARVLSRQYKTSRSTIADIIRRLTQTANVVTVQPVVEAGLATLEAGGDFADGVIAFEGAWLGAETLVTFDKRAARLIQAQGKSVHLLTPAQDGRSA